MAGTPAVAKNEEGFEGEVMVAGSTNWARVGRDSNYDGLMTPHRIKALIGIKISKIYTGAASAHSVAITQEGQCYVWGRNEQGQLGVGDTNVRNSPVLLQDLAQVKVTHAATGKHHTVLVTSTGTTYSCGMNTSGQCGQGNLKSPITTMTQVRGLAAVNVSKVSCGSDFTMFLTSTGTVFACGSPENGQLGNGSDGKYFVSASKMSFNFKADPFAIAVFNQPDNAVADIACGLNHTVAMLKNHKVMTWGFGGFGRLGHKDAKDVMLPKCVEMFDRPNYGAMFISAGATASFAITVTNQLYMWGITKKTGEANMYPKPFSDLSGWNIRSLSCGPTSCACAADDKTITWGPSPTYGELAYGDDKPKSSTRPQVAETFTGLYTQMVASGYGHSLFLVRRTTDVDAELIEKMPVYEGADDVAAVEEAPAAAKKKGRPAAAAAAEPVAKKAKAGKKK